MKGNQKIDVESFAAATDRFIRPAGGDQTLKVQKKLLDLPKHNLIDILESYDLVKSIIATMLD